MAYSFWTQDEIDLLLDLAGNYPTTKLINTYNQKATELGLRTKTRQSIRAKMMRMGLSMKAEYDNFTMKGLAKILGIRPETVKNWVDNMGLTTRKLSKRKDKNISRYALTLWAKEHPKCFWGLDYERLCYVLNDQKFALYCSQQKRIHIPKKVINRTTGEIYPTVSDAARKNFTHPCTIRRSINLKKPTIWGHRFEYF